jgi:putative oxidoreductase
MKQALFNQDLGLLVFRIIIGFTMAFAHGIGKMPPPDMLVEGVGAMGFPMPIVFAWSAALSEFLGGILIGLGLWTRLASFLLGFTMAVAFFIVHGADPFAKKEMAFLYLAACILLVFQGAGKYSLDRLVRKV